MKQVKTQKSHERMESALKSIQEIQNKQKKKSVETANLSMTTV